MTHPARRPVWEVFSHRNYTLFMLGLGPAAISSWMQRVGIGWLAWELTHSPVWLGVIAAADLVPRLCRRPWRHRWALEQISCEGERAT